MNTPESVQPVSGSRPRFRPLRTQEIIAKGRDVVNKVPLALRVILAAAALVVVLGINAALAIRSSENVFDEQEKLRKGLLVEKDISSLLSMAKDMETGVRGYFVTGDGKYLEPYNKALGALPASLDSLIGRLGGDAQSSGLTVAFIQQLTLLLNQSQEFLRLRQDAPNNISMAVFTSLLERQKAVMDSVRVTAETLRQDQDRVTVGMGERLGEVRQNQKMSIILPSILSVVLALFIFSILLRDTRLTQKAAIEREQSLKQEREARAEAEAANQAKDDFVSMVSHELRTPLQSILGWTQFLNKSLADKTQVSTQPLLSPVGAMERSARALARMIDDLLDVSRALTGKLAIQPQAMDFAEVVRQALETVSPAATAKRVRLLSGISPQPLGMVGDADRLRQVVVNVIGNAIKFTPSEGTVAVAAEQVNSRIEFCVRDSGVGIAKELLPRVFDRYVQASSTSTRQFGGLGLGLAIVKHLVEMHGGKVEATSEGPGLGAEFTIRLPIAAVAPPAHKIIQLDHPPAALAAPVENDASPTAASSHARLQGLAVMVVDDDADVRNVLTMLLAEEGAEITLAASAREALALLAVTHVGVVLSDIGMPDMDGYALASAIRALKPGEAAVNANVPLVALTAFSRPDDVKRSMEAGFNHHLAKPVDFEKLVEMLLRDAACEWEAPQQSAL